MPFLSFGQNDNSLNFNTYNGVPYMDEEMVFDTIGIMMDSVEMSYYDKIDKIRGMDIIVVTTAKTDEEARELLSLMGAPFYRS